MSAMKISTAQELGSRDSSNVTVWYMKNCKYCMFSKERKDAQKLAEFLAARHIQVYEADRDLVTDAYLAGQGVQGFPAVVMTRPGAVPVVVKHGETSGGFDLQNVKGAVTAFFNQQGEDPMDVEGGKKKAGKHGKGKAGSRASRSPSRARAAGSKRRRSASPSSEKLAVAGGSSESAVEGGSVSPGIEGGKRKTVRKHKTKSSGKAKKHGKPRAMSGGSRVAVIAEELIDSDSDSSSGSESGAPAALAEAKVEAMLKVEGALAAAAAAAAVAESGSDSDSDDGEIGGGAKKHGKRSSKSKSMSPRSKKGVRASKKSHGSAAGEKKEKRPMSPKQLMWKAEVDAWEAKGFIRKDAMQKAKEARASK